MSHENSFFFKKLDKPLWGLSFYFILALVVYWNNCGTSFVDDSLEWIVSFKKFGWEGYAHSYDMTSVYWFHDLFSNVMHSLFGRNNFMWYLIILFFHTSACYFIYRFLLLVLNHTNRMNSNLIAFLSSIIFLLGAYNTENIFWIATYHYEITILYLFISLTILAKSRGNFEWIKHGWMIIIFPFMLTMHEISFFFPFAFILTIVYFRLEELPTRRLTYDLLKFGLPFAIFSILILLLTKLIKGSFIPHYGISHVQDHSVYGFFYTLVNYLVKHLFFIHNFSFQVREKCYDVDTKTMYGLFAIVILAISFILYKIRRRWNSYRDYCLLILMLLLFFIPVSNMYFFWHFPIQNDRLFYYPSIFLYALFVLIVVDNLKKLGLVIAVLFLIVNMIFLRLNIAKIEESIHFTEKIAIPSYKPYLNAKPIVLNLPYNYKGFYSFRKIFRFKSSMYWAYDRDIDFTYTTSMPFFCATDSIRVDKIDDSSFKIHLQSSGSWLMRESLGGSDYENDDVKVDFAGDNQSATIYLKKMSKSSPILYCTGNRGFVEYKVARP